MNPTYSKLIPASAGSGKTYTLTKLLTHGLTSKPWSADAASNSPALDQALRADRLVAVTFTEAAAAELKQRIRGDLLSAGSLDEAAQLDDAYVSTIHAFGFRLLRETAFDRGDALAPRLLTEDEQAQLLRQTLGHSEIIDRVTRDLGRWGYRYDFNSGASAADAFRARVLKIIGLLTACGASRPLEEFLFACKSHAELVYSSPRSETAEVLAESLRGRVRAMLAAFPHSLSESHGKSATAKRDFAGNYVALMAARDTDRLDHDWALWVNLCDLRKTKRGCPTPDNYDELADAVMAAASVIHTHPGPLTDAHAHIDVLLKAARDASDRYAVLKRRSGLLDYSDMVSGAGSALKEESIRKLIAGRVDCVVVDEFQDTNPQQFDLIWSVMRGDLPSVVVGDLKQSIMGFQGADPRLFQALLESHPAQVEPLDRNWRSQPALMQIINAMSRQMFADYRDLQPKGKDSLVPALHVLAMPDRPNTKTDKWRGARVAEALAAKLKDPSYVITDRRTGEQRPVRGGDCAVLCPTHSMLGHYAEALRTLGLKVRLLESGWSQTEEIQIALSTLALVHDPSDLHARLYLAVTDLGSFSLEAALKLMASGQALVDPSFAAIEKLSAQAQRLSVDQLIPLALEASGLFDRILHWPNARQARANLLKLEGMAKEFVDAQPESRMAAGIYGTGLPQFICWVHQQIERGDTMPPASTIDEDAIELVTWHASKGREWPLVAVCGMADKVEPRLPDLRLKFPSFDQLDKLVETAEISWSPDFHSAEAQARVRQTLVVEEAAESMREAYVAITRPREQLILEWPLNAIGGDKVTRASLLREKIGLKLDEDSIQLASGESFDAIVEYADVRRSTDASDRRDSLTGTAGRIALKSDAWDGALTPDTRSPSAHDSIGDSPAMEFQEFEYSDPLSLPPHADPLAVGNFVHRCFEVGFATGRATTYLGELAEELWPSDADAVIAAVRVQIEQFKHLLESRLRATNVSSEVPVSGLDADKVVVNGVIDMLAETEQGLLIIDHKTDRGITAEEIVARYQQQVMDYAAVLQGAKIQGLAINALMQGKLLVIGHAQ